MTFWDIVKSIFELGLVVFTIWGIFHEDRFVAFEEKIAAYFRRKGLRVIKGGYNSSAVTSVKATKI